MRLWLVGLLTLALLPVSVTGARAQEESAQPPAEGIVETIKEKAGEAVEATEEFFTPPAADPALAQEPLPTEIADAMAEGAEAEHSGGGLPQFDPTWFASQLFWLAIAFGVMYMVFSRRTLPEISSIIDNRKNHIQADLDQAEDLTTQAESVQEAYEKGLQGARDQSAIMINDVHAAMQTKKAEQSEAFRLKSEAQVKSTEERLATAKDKAMGEISDIVAEVAAQAVQKIIGVPTDAKQAKSIVSRLSDDKAKAA